MPRVVLDTNVLIAAARAPRSASRKIVAACLDGRVEAVVSEGSRKEYDLIIDQALSGVAYVEQIRKFIDACLPVEPLSVPRVVQEDPEDDKLVALAIAAHADVLVTSDDHLASLGEVDGSSPILSPSKTLARFPEISS